MAKPNQTPAEKETEAEKVLDSNPTRTPGPSNDSSGIDNQPATPAAPTPDPTASATAANLIPVGIKTPVDVSGGTEPARLDVSVPGGRYIVNGRPVNAAGEPIK